MNAKTPLSQFAMVIIVASSIAGCSGDKPGLSGKFTAQDVGETLEFLPDRTFAVVDKQGEGLWGNYDIDGHSLILRFIDGKVSQGTLNGNAILLQNHTYLAPAR